MFYKFGSHCNIPYQKVQAKEGKKVKTKVFHSKSWATIETTGIPKSRYCRKDDHNTG